MGNFIDAGAPAAVDATAASSAMLTGSGVLWEWCADISGDHWKPYSADVNDAIERAFQASERRVDIAVGSRRYTIIYGPEPDGARQEDPVRKKRRRVRRRVLELDERRTLLREDPAPAAAASRVAVWEWDKQEYGDAWGHYSADVNDAIEQAYQAHETCLEIEVGIRRYTIMFGPKLGLARQQDSERKKSRGVRRRMVAPDERNSLLHPSGDDARGAEVCVLCMDVLNQNTNMPVAVLPLCGHRFHAACAQLLADDRKPCPLCKRSVDWRTVLPKVSRGLRKGAGKGGRR